MKTLALIKYTCLFLAIIIHTDAYGGSIELTKHNLSVSGPGPVKSATEDRICVFCHAPDRTSQPLPFLWNKKISRAHYIPYQSSTLYAEVGQPTGTSKLCLSCHDGTIALGAILKGRRGGEVPFKGGSRFIPWRAKIGTDLSDDHPISFVYDNALAARNGELANPDTLGRKVKLDANRELQCTTCHDAHDNTFGSFLVMSNSYSNLCTTCHRKKGWSSSSHRVSNARWNGEGTNPWKDTPYRSVDENGCKNCHDTHSAEGAERLLNYIHEEDNCLVCHNGNVADLDIERELSKPYKHAVQDYAGIHDPAEDYSIGDKKKEIHVECVDCHNSHQSNSAPSGGAPQVSGLLRGVTGIDATGKQKSVSNYEYEICFKCHGDANVITKVQIDRSLQQLNTRLEFDPSSPSYHPVISEGVNPDVPSLSTAYTTASIIFCTDCHSSDDDEGPRGPHSSIYKYLLERNYTTDDYTEENAFNYDLCYKCHERSSILNDESFPEHRRHVVDERTPCSACHDPHGISITQGNAMNNSNLINFDLSIVQPDSQDRLLFEDTGVLSGQCFLSCHGSIHDETKAYPASAE
jgi:predicted CXXCH cytochrome family protein